MKLYYSTSHSMISKGWVPYLQDPTFLEWKCQWRLWTDNKVFATKQTFKGFSVELKWKDLLISARLCFGLCLWAWTASLRRKALDALILQSFSDFGMLYFPRRKFKLTSRKFLQLNWNHSHTTKLTFPSIYSLPFILICVAPNDLFCLQIYTCERICVLSNRCYQSA